MITMEQIKEELLAKNAELECNCGKTLEEDDEHIEVECEKCRQLEEINSMCTCGKCNTCLQALIDRISQEPCTCTYKTIQEEVTYENGFSEVVDKQVLDVKCQRCINIDDLNQRLEWNKMFEQAYIPFELWDRCTVVDGVIIQKDDTATLEEKINSIVSELNSYKHEYITFIEYDGCHQRTLPEDRVMILDCQESLERKLKTEIAWKYPEKYKVVTDPQYFVDMRMAIGLAIEKAFNTEYMLVQEIQKLTENTVDSYNMKDRFAEVFKTL